MRNPCNRHYCVGKLHEYCCKLSRSPALAHREHAHTRHTDYTKIKKRGERRGWGDIQAPVLWSGRQTGKKDSPSEPRRTSRVKQDVPCGARSPTGPCRWCASCESRFGQIRLVPKTATVWEIGEGRSRYWVGQIRPRLIPTPPATESICLLGHWPARWWLRLATCADAGRRLPVKPHTSSGDMVETRSL